MRSSLQIMAPLLEATRPEAIVEVGAGDVDRTRRLLDLSGAWGGTLHAIDPLPRFPVDSWKTEYGARFQFHRDSSVNVLPRIERADAYIIDGDHNWYTVRQALDAIELGAQANPGRPFPLVLLHGTGWPYARRDSYCDPRTIPEEYRHRFRQAGVLPG